MEPGFWLKGWRRGLASKSFGNRTCRGRDGWGWGEHTNLYNVKAPPIGEGRTWVGNYPKRLGPHPQGFGSKPAWIKSQRCQLPIA